MATESSSIFHDAATPRRNTIQFRMAPTHVAYANTLRRVIMSGVETVAFRADMNEVGATTDVKVEANTTPMTHEMLAHRIGLIPLHVEDPLKWEADKYEFVLDVSNESEIPKDVTAADFRVFEQQGETKVPVPSHRFFRPHHVTGDTALIAVLKPKIPGGKPEEIRVTAKATTGIGRENARFIPTAQCAYAYTRDTDPERVKAFFENWLKKTKNMTAQELEAQPEKRGPLEREFQTLEINRCYLVNDEGEPYSFDFTVESVGVLSPTYIVGRGCEVAAALCARFGSGADESLPEEVLVKPAEGRILGWDFVFPKQDHTLGHTLQSWLDVNKVGRGEVTFAGYDIPHPLTDEMVIRIGVADGQEATARRVLKEAARSCAQMFSQWKKEWDAFTGGVTRQVASTTMGPGAATAAPKKKILRRPGATVASTPA